jgi:Trypsin
MCPSLHIHRYKSAETVKNLVIVLGNGVRRDVSKVVMQTFDPVNRNDDIAILRLCKPIKFDKTIKPACLSPRNFNADGERVHYFLFSFNFAG